MATVFKQGADDDLVGRKVFGAQHPQAGFVRLARRSMGLGIRMAVGQQQVHMEGAAQPRAAFHADVAPHQAHQLAGDGQPQAAAAIAACGGGVGLLELLEEPRERVGVHADAGVAHFKVQSRAGVLTRQVAHMQAHGACLGELHGIAQQVHQHLAQARGVAHHVHRHARVHVHVKGDALVGRPLAQQGDHVIEQGVQVEVNGLHIQLAGFDLGQIQHVVEQGQQRLRIAVCKLQLLPGFGREVGIAQRERLHADDTGNGRANLVAHHGQELALCAAGCVSGFLGLHGLLERLAHALLQPPALGHVGHQGEARRLAVPVHGHAAQVHPGQGAIGRHQSNLKGIGLALAAAARAVLIEHGLVVVRVDAPEDGASTQAFAVPLQEPLRTGVGEHDAVLHAHHDGFRHVVQHHLRALGLGQVELHLLLQPPALSDIDHKGQCGRPALPLNANGRHLQPALLPFKVDQPKRLPAGVAVAQTALEQAVKVPQHQRPVVVVNAIEEVNRVLARELTAGDGLGARVGKDHDAVLNHQDAVGGVGDQGAVALLRAAHGLLGGQALGEVGEHRQRRDAPIPRHHGHAGLGPYRAAVLTTNPEAVVAGHGLALEVGANPTGRALHVIGKGGLLKGLANQLVVFVAGQLAGLGVAQHDVTILVDANGFGHMLNHIAVARVQRGQRLLGVHQAAVGMGVVDANGPEGAQGAEDVPLRLPVGVLARGLHRQHAHHAVTHHQGAKQRRQHHLRAGNVLAIDLARLQVHGHIAALARAAGGIGVRVVQAHALLRQWPAEFISEAQHKGRAVALAPPQHEGGCIQQRSRLGAQRPEDSVQVQRARQAQANARQAVQQGAGVVGVNGLGEHG